MVFLVLVMAVVPEEAGPGGLPGGNLVGDLLRAVRRSHSEPKTIFVSSADPLNLVGILTSGPRVSPYSNQAIVYREGVPVDIGPLGAVRSRLQGAQTLSDLSSP